MKILFNCLYCGNNWSEIVWTEAAITNKMRCGICKETKLIKTIKLGEEGLDVFGYRFSLPFSSKESRY